MPDLIFTTRGQAEVLAAQEKLAASARRAKQEFEEGARMTRAWDEATARLARTSEAALRSINTEQEKIAQKIDLIQQRQAKGIGSTEQNTEAIRRLRQQWVNVDNTTQQHTTSTDRLGRVIGKAFDPALIVRWGSSFLGVQAVLAAVKNELADIQAGIDKRLEVTLKPKERLEKFKEDIKQAKADVARETEQLATQREQLADAERREGRQETERKADIRTRIGDTRLDLGRAREDRELARQAAGREAAEQKARRIERTDDIQRNLRRAMDDRDNARTPAARLGADRRIEDLKRQLQRVGKDDQTPAGDELRNVDRRIADLTTQLSRLEQDLAEPGDASALEGARRSVTDAEKQLTASQQKLGKLRGDRAAFQATPEFRRYQRVAGRQANLEAGFGELAGLGDQGALSSAELQVVDATLREAGQQHTRRRLLNIYNRGGDLAVNEKEAAAALRQAVRDLRTEAVPLLSTAPQGPVTFRAIALDRLDSKAQMQIEILERMARQLENNPGLVGTSE
jgi:hypothetical protein